MEIASLLRLDNSCVVVAANCFHRTELPWPEWHLQIISQGLLIHLRHFANSFSRGEHAIYQEYVMPRETTNIYFILKTKTHVKLLF